MPYNRLNKDLKMATINVLKISTKIQQNIVTIIVADMQVIHGIIHFIPRAKKFQHYLLTTNNCKIIK